MSSAWLDKKYLNLISVRLQRFTWKSANLANHRCPFCGDSKKNKLKARGYHFLKKGGFFYDCKNCPASMSTGNFIKALDPELHKEYVMERYMNGDNGFSNYEKPKAKDFGFDSKPQFVEKSLLAQIMDPISKLDDDHIAKKYVTSRMIPEKLWDELYFIDDTQKLESMSEKQKDKFTDHHEPRMVIPFYGRDGVLTGVTARALTDVEDQLRYVAIKIADDVAMIYGLDKVDFTSKIYVTEGPIDSMFLPNSIAAGNANLAVVKDYVPKDACVLIFDYQPRNKELVSIIRKAIKQGFAVTLLPPDFPGKDINKAIENGLTQEQIVKIIDNNTYKGLIAEVEFAKWAKIK